MTFGGGACSVLGWELRDSTETGTSDPFGVIETGFDEENRLIVGRGTVVVVVD